MENIQIELVTPEKLFTSTEAEMVTVPGAGGDFGVLVNHAPMISTIRAGIVELTKDGSTDKIFVDGGLVEVTNERCTILAENAVEANSLSSSEIQELIDKAAA